MRLHKRKEKPAPHLSGFGIIQRRSIVAALEKARTANDAPAIESALRLLTMIDESGLGYLAWPL